jgi:hypothetical protein
VPGGASTYAQGVNEELLALVLAALDTSGLDEDVAELVLAACESAATLDAVLAGASVERPDPPAKLELTAGHGGSGSPA